MKKYSSIVVLAILTTLTACGDGTKVSDDKVTLKFGNLTPEHAILAGEKFKEIAEAEDPSLEVVLYHKNILGSDRVLVESTQLGDIDIAASATAPLADAYPDFYAFDIPYLFSDEKHADSVVDGSIGQEMLDGLGALDLKGLGYWENGFRNLTGNKLMRVPADVKGMKLRTMENEIHILAWKAIGANPTPMASSERFTALQQGTIDGQENPFPEIESAKLQEVQKHMTVTEHVWAPWVLVMNLDKFNSLNPSQQKAILKASRESALVSREVARRMDKEVRERFKTQGVTITELTPQEKQLWQDKVIAADIFSLVKEKMDHPDYLDQIISIK